MVDFLNGNLCGASPELNDVLGKLDDAKAEITGAMDSLASVATSAFGAKQNELKALTDKLQTIEIPTLPKLNFQSEIASLTSQIPGSPSYISALAKIKSEFGSDLITKGLKLESLVTDAAAAILGGGNVCALAPNLEKEAASSAAAIEKPAAVKQAAAPAVTEASSKVWQNPDVEEKVKENEEKTESYTVTKTPPTEDAGSFTVSKETKKISVKKTVITVSPQGSSSNVVDSKSDGWIDKKTYIVENVKLEDLKISGNMITFLKLKHKPYETRFIYVHTPDNADIFVEADDDTYVRTFDTVNEFNFVKSSWEADGKPPYYESKLGLHMIEAIAGATTLGETQLDEDDIPVKIGTDGTVTFKSRYIPTRNHPGNIVSVNPLYFTPSYSKSIKVFGRGKRSYFKNYSGLKFSDTQFNKAYKGYAARIGYFYLENYNPEPKQ